METRYGVYAGFVSEYRVKIAPMWDGNLRETLPPVGCPLGKNRTNVGWKQFRYGFAHLAGVW